MSNYSKSDSPGKLERLAERYEHNPVLRGLVQLIPGLSSADTVVTTAVSNLREKRVRAFFDALSERNTPLTEEEIKNDDFLHAFFATTHAVLNTRQEEKIRLFASLFSQYTTGDMDASADTYEEHLSILSDISLREFQLLCILHQFEQNTPYSIISDEFASPEMLASENLKLIRKNERASIFWDEFIKESARNLAIVKDEVPAMLTRLYRTGLCRRSTSPGVIELAFLTPNFHSFIQAFGIAPQQSTQGNEEE